MSSPKIGIAFGALCRDIKDQLAGYGVQLPEEKAAAIQKDSNAITRLCIKGIATESETHKMRRRLMKAIMKELIK